MYDFATTLQAGAAEYADALALLQDRGLPAQFTQTGGMCAAIEARLDGAVLLITDAEDSLPWDRAEHRGWEVGLYTNPESTDGPVVFADTADGSLAALGALPEDVGLPAVMDGRVT